MLADDLGSNRVKDARAREEAYLEHAVRQADEANRNSTMRMPVINEHIQEAEGTAAPDTPVNAAASMPNDFEELTWEERLAESDFHDVVNDDSDMYDAIDNIPDDADSVADQVMAVIQNHVSEVWSPPRVTKLAAEFGLSPGFAYDFVVGDENGNPWDFDKPEQREKCVKHIMEQKPQFPIGSPMCTAFSALQGLNKWRVVPRSGMH